MDKSSKKPTGPAVLSPAAPDVVASAAVIPKVKARKKREAEDKIERAVTAKKLKRARAQEVPKAAAKKQPSPKKADSRSSDEEPSKAEGEFKVQPKMAARPVKHESSNVSSQESSGEPQIPASNKDQAPSTKTLLVDNLPFAVDSEDVKQFFSGVADAVDVRLATYDDGHPKGFGYVQFATAEDAEKAIVLNGQDLMGRAVRLKADENGARAAPTRDCGMYAKPIGGPNLSVYVKGFDKSQQRDDIESSLYKHFSKCGEVTRVSVPLDYGSREIRGIAFIDFSKESSFNEALKLSGSSLGGHHLYVTEARPKAEHAVGGCDGGGRSDGRGGGRRKGGRGFQKRQSAGTASAGKKITFDND